MTKKELRKQYKEKRSSLSESEYQQRCERIVEKVLENFDFSTIHYLHLFLPIRIQKEIDTFPLIEQLQLKYPQLRLVVPRVVPNSFEMEHYLYDVATITLSEWGIPEPMPDSSQKVSPQKIDTVLLPLLVFDEKGNRVGYGKGFYDRFLTECRPEVQKIGLCLEGAVPLIEEVGEWDIPLDFCVSPQRCYEFGVKN
ncbi:5-formyltetrahydrofolate cyclo-ligase [Emticicia sp. ODNR4P]|nr:5-formyltetrahydrofolate cyclo-ligase [Emticicia sp. ODNR4P]